MSANGTDPGLQAAKQLAVPNRLKELVSVGKIAHSFSVKFINSIEVIHLAAAVGYDTVMIDLEHGSFSLDSASTLSCAALQVG